MGLIFISCLTVLVVHHFYTHWNDSEPRPFYYVQLRKLQNDSAEKQASSPRLIE